MLHMLEYSEPHWRCSCSQWSFDPGLQRTGRSGVIEHERHVRSLVKSSWLEEMVIVDCDENCGALKYPTTLDECQKTIRHFREHRLMSGCPCCGS